MKQETEISVSRVIYKAIHDSYVSKELKMTEAQIYDLRDKILRAIKNEKLITTEKFLFIEDGSVDLDELDNLAITNPEIKIIVVRQGGRLPVLQEVK